MAMVVHPVVLAAALIALAGCYRSHAGVDAELAEPPQRGDERFPGVAGSDGEPGSGASPWSASGQLTVTPIGGTPFIRPGETVILLLEVDNPDEENDPVVSTIVQFGPAGESVEVARTSSPAPNRIENTVLVDPGLCDYRCAEIHDLLLFEAVRLASGRLSEPAERNVRLDCTEHGDSDLCPGASGGGRAERLLDAVVAMFDEMCRCNGQDVEWCPGIVFDEPCMLEVFGRYEAEYAEQIDCTIYAFDEMNACLRSWSCDTSLMQSCFALTTPAPDSAVLPFSGACGDFTLSFTEELVWCFSVYSCGDGQTISADQQCDGVFDCADGSDETSCPGFAPPSSGFFLCENGNPIPLERVCDGQPDCAGGADETICPRLP